MTYAPPELSLLGLESEPKKTILRPHIRVGATIYPHANDPVFSGREKRERYLNWNRDETEGTITSFAWSKKMGEPAGNWSATVKVGRNAKLSPADGDVMDGDWIDFTVLRNGVLFPLCRGVIDTVTDSGVSSGGAKVRTLSVVGRDHGALFMLPIAWNNIFVQSVSELTLGFLTQKVKGEVGGGPSKMFKLLLDAAFAGGSGAKSAWTMPSALISKTNHESFGGELRVVNDTPTRGAYYNEIQLWTQAGQTLHQTLNQWCNPLLNEYWYDLELSGDTVSKIGSTTKPGHKMEATIRERPYVNTSDGLGSPWFKLFKTTIPSWLIERDTLARSGRERFTGFQIIADFQYGNAQEQAALGAPLWSPQDVERYGVRMYQESTKYINDTAIGGWVAEKNNWQRLVADWFGPNPYWLSGSLELATMLPELRIGQRLIVDTGNPKHNLSALLEGIEHSYEFAGDGTRGPRSRTKLLLTRGFRGTDEELLKMVQTVSSRFNTGIKQKDTPLTPAYSPSSRERIGA